MLFISFIVIYIFIFSNLEYNKVLSEQKPFKIKFYTSFAKQNIPLYNENFIFSSLNQDIFNY